MKRSALAAETASRDRHWNELAIGVAIVVAVILVYLPSLGGGFVWDDEQLITGNPLLRTLSGLGEIWSGGRTADYFPVTNTVFWIEWHLFGNHPLGYHVINVLLQAADSLLVWIVLRQLAIPGAWLAGFLFAIHPVNAESVAWISELKNLLAMLFVLLSLLCFFRKEDARPRRRIANYLASICFFVLALLSKSQAVFLPFVLLLCEWWRAQDRDSAGFRRMAAQTFPFFLAAILFGLTTIWFQNRGIGEEVIAIGSLGRRLANAGMAIWWYTAKVLIPVRLIAIYRPWKFDSVPIWDWMPLIGLVLLIVLLWYRRNRGTKGAFFAVACFVLALLPVLGLVRMAYVRSGTLVADHFVYFAGVPLLALIAAAIVRIWSRGQRFIRVPLIIIVAGAVLASGIYTSTRAAVFRDEERLWQDTLSKNPNAWQAQARLGLLLFNQQDYEGALSHLESAIRLKPELAENRNLLGLEYRRLQRFEEGITQYREALALEEAQPSMAQSPTVATIRTNLANALTLSANNIDGGTANISEEAFRRYQEAIEQYEKALEIEPEQPAIHRNLGILLARLGRNDEAIAHLRKTLQLVPDEPTAREILNEIEAQRQ